MLTVKQLLEEAQDKRLERLPNYARDLVRELASRLRSVDADRTRILEEATEEMTALKALLEKGPEGSDTFLSLPYSRYVEQDMQEGPRHRPLGQGVSIDFMPPGKTDTGYRVRLQGDGLHVETMGQLSIVPVNPRVVLLRTTETGS